MPDYCSIRSFKPIKPITRKSRSVGAARAAILRSDIARSAKLSPVANIRYICRFYAVQSVSLSYQSLLLSTTNCSDSLAPIALGLSIQLPGVHLMAHDQFESWRLNAQRRRRRRSRTLNCRLRPRDNIGMASHTRDRLWMLITGLARLRWTDSHPVYYHRLSQAITVFLYWHRRAILCGQYTLTLTWNKGIDGMKVRQAAGIQGNDSVYILYIAHR